MLKKARFFIESRREKREDERSERERELQGGKETGVGVVFAQNRTLASIHGWRRGE